MIDLYRRCNPGATPSDTIFPVVRAYTYVAKTMKKLRNAGRHLAGGLQIEMLIDALSICSYNLRDGNIAEQSRAQGHRPLQGPWS